MSRLNILPDDLLHIVWKQCFSYVLEDMMTRYHWNNPPTKKFFNDLKYNTRIRYLSDYGWQTGIYKGPSVTTHFNDLPFYYVDDGNCCTHIVHPLRPISCVLLRHVHVEKMNPIQQKRYSVDASLMGSFASFAAHFRLGKKGRTNR